MLELKNVYSGYEKNDILNGLCACFEKGKLTVIIGRNGCGKSTLLKTIMGIVSYQGKISLDGTDISLMKRSECAKRISYLSQGRSIPDMTVGQMVLHGRFPYLKYPGRYSKADYEIARKAMRRMNIEELEHTPISSLSGGIRQNVYIAMALAQDTDYILLDEPTTYLDISHQLALMQTLRELAAEGKGVIAVMHDLPISFTFADTIAVLDKGILKENISPDKLCASGIIEEVFGISMDFSEEKGEYHYRYT